ncbi:hypothetical protein ACLMJV_05330, partial [Sinorhizobium meliloti]|uniref:hypothetical protein n=1 Tax=Rhizobium meliloti TaxID=382 RepID=UPI00398C9927
RFGRIYRKSFAFSLLCDLLWVRTGLRAASKGRDRGQIAAQHERKPKIRPGKYINDEGHADLLPGIPSS